MRKTDVEMVFAASFDNELTLYLFPRTLEINVSCRFKHSAEIGKTIRQALEMSDTSLKRLDDAIKSSFYSMTWPIRRFKVQSFKIQVTREPSKTRHQRKNCLSVENSQQSMTVYY